MSLDFEVISSKHPAVSQLRDFQTANSELILVTFNRISTFSIQDNEQEVPLLQVSPPLPIDADKTLKVIADMIEPKWKTHIRVPAIGSDFGGSFMAIHVGRDSS
jgi:hypothetical protein